MSTAANRALGLLLTLGASSLPAQTNTEIVFQCNLTIQIAAGRFDPAVDQVVVRGELNGWGCSAPMADEDGDGIYELVIQRSALVPGSYPYKFNMDCLESRWEGGDNRFYTATGAEPDADGNGFVEVAVQRYFDDVDALGEDTEVLFQCDMTVQIGIGSFIAGVDTVHVRGDINDWACTELLDEDGDGTYAATIQQLAVPARSFNYKFNVNCSDRWEGGGDRSYAVTGAEPDTDADGYREVEVRRYFDDIDTGTPTHDTAILFRCDMSVQIALGRFAPDVSTLQLRGEINGWGCTEMRDDDADSIYEVAFELARLPEKTYEYKFNIDCGTLWEDGGNRQYTVDGTAPDTDADGFGEIVLLRSFNDLSAEDVLLADTVVVFAVDLTPARNALEAGATIAPVQDHGAPIASFDEIATVGVTGPFSGWNWTQLTPENLLADDGSGLDERAGDLVFTGSYLLPGGSSRDLVYKFSLNGYDNEAGVGDDHLVRLDGDAPQVRLPIDCFGSLNTDARLPFGQVDGAYNCEPVGIPFVRGDCNGDDRKDLSDAVFDLSHLFSGGRAPACLDACDMNSDARNDVSDPVYLLNHLFLGGPAPAAPFPDCGRPAEERLGCAGATCRVARA